MVTLLVEDVLDANHSAITMVISWGRAPTSRMGPPVPRAHECALRTVDLSRPDQGICDVDLTTSNRPLNVVVIYQPPSSVQYLNPFCVFISEFRTFLQEQVTMSGHLIPLGDFNIHVDVSSNCEVKLFLELLELHYDKILHVLCVHL